jgi:hypothetical protein
MSYPPATIGQKCGKRGGIPLNGLLGFLGIAILVYLFRNVIGWFLMLLFLMFLFAAGFSLASKFF